MHAGVTAFPIFPTTYAQAVVDHAKARKRRGKNPSMRFLDKKNPRQALAHAEAVLKSPKGIIRYRLENLRKFLPEQDQLVYEFAGYIANSAAATLVPQGFVLMSMLALDDLEHGRKATTQESIRNDLVGLPAAMYTLLEAAIPIIAKAVFPRDFAKSVEITMDKVKMMQ